MKTTVAYSVNDQDDRWIVFCPNCDHSQEYEGFFDPADPYTCKMCKKEFTAKHMEIEGGIIK